MNYPNRPGRALVAHMRVMRDANEPNAIAARLLYRAAAKLACDEMVAKYPAMTIENFAEAFAFQEARIAFHKLSLAGKVTHKTKLAPDGTIIKF